MIEVNRVRRSVRALDGMDAQEQASHYLRRFHLVELVKYYKDLQYGQNTGDSAPRRERAYKYNLRKKISENRPTGTQRPARLALDELMC
jgi:hypothetical protein